MRFFSALVLFFGCACAASAQTTPVDVQFKLIGMTDNYDADPPPLPGETVRLILGETPDWQSPNAGHRFVTDSKGEARFTMDVPLDSRIRSRNIGFTPFSSYSRSEHMKIAVELKHELPVDQTGATKTFRWLLTMDVDCFKGGTCSTNDFMTIVTPDAQGRFTKTLARQSGSEAWLVPELGNKVMWGMSYKAADFMLSADENDPKKRTLRFVVKRLPRPVQR